MIVGFQRAGAEQVVAIQEKDVFALGVPRAVMSRGFRTRINLAQYFYWGAVGGEDGLGFVCGTVVDDDQLEVFKGLSQDRANGFAVHVLGTVVNRPDNAKAHS